MRGMYCLSLLGSLYRSTWFGGQVASPRDKEGYSRIAINSKLTISEIAYYALTSSLGHNGSVQTTRLENKLNR